jgi:hypothetical protein
VKTTSYNSGPPNNFSSLSEKTWQEFSKYISWYQWALDEPSNCPRKSEIAHAILNKGKPGSCTFLRKEGYKFVLRPLHKWGFEQAVTQQRKLFYVSSGKTALLYFDIDLHNTWQTKEEGQEAKRLIEALFCRCFGRNVIFWSESKRGINGYLKVNSQGMLPGDSNVLFGYLENALQRLLAYHKNLADFEIKGRFGFIQDDEYHWSQFGKLPIHSQNWNFLKLKEFADTPTVLLARLNFLSQQIEDKITQDVLTNHKAHKKSLGDAPITNKRYFLVTPTMKTALEKKYGENWIWQFAEYSGDEEAWWLSLKYYRPGKLPMTEEEWRESQKPSTPAIQVEEPVPHVKPVPLVRVPRRASSRVNCDFSDLVEEPDSFKRQQKALLRYARYLKRVPSVEEALNLIRQHRLFSGSWEENEAKRSVRVQTILEFIAQTFDASKCAKGSVNVGKYDEWAVKKFPNGIKARSRRTLNQEGMWIEGRYRTSVDPKFISVFMSIVEFGLLVDKNKDGSLPHKRGEQIWNALYVRGVVSVKFCARKWAVCRNELVYLDIIKITDFNYSAGKAMKWEENRYFPGLGLWKGEKEESQLESGCYTKREERREEEHNTWLYKRPVEMSPLSRLNAPRPPPYENQAAASDLQQENDIPERKGPWTIRTDIDRSAKQLTKRKR